MAGIAALYAVAGSPSKDVSVRLVHPASERLIEQIECGQAIVPPSYQVLEVASGEDDQERILVSEVQQLGEEEIASVDIQESEEGQEIHLTLSDEGVEEWRDLAADYPGREIAVVSGDGEVLSLEQLPSKLRSKPTALHFTAR